MAKPENTKASDPNAVEEEVVAVRVLMDEAGYGFRAGEIRGFAKSIAEKMQAKKHGEILTEAEIKAIKAEKNKGKGKPAKAEKPAA